MKVALMLLALLPAVLAGCASGPLDGMSEAPVGAEEVHAQDPPRPTVNETLTKRDVCQDPVLSTTSLRYSQGVFSYDVPDGFSHAHIEIAWDAVAAPGTSLGAWLGPKDALFIHEAWAVAEPEDPFVFDVGGDKFAADSFEVVFYADGPDVINGDDAAVVASCSYDVTMQVFTFADET